MSKAKITLPVTESRCSQEQCVYNSAGLCDEPRINKENSDSYCHDISVGRVIKFLDIDTRLTAGLKKVVG